MGLADEVWGILQKAAIVLGITGFLSALALWLQLSRVELLQVFTLLAIGVLLLAGFRDLGKRVDRLREQLPPIIGANPNGKPKRPKDDTSGAGAFGGMIVGGLLGLAYGPPGVIVGGVIGAIFGDALERESSKRNRH